MSDWGFSRDGGGSGGGSDVDVDMLLYVGAATTVEPTRATNFSRNENDANIFKREDAQIPDVIRILACSGSRRTFAEKECDGKVKAEALKLINEAFCVRSKQILQTKWPEHAEAFGTPDRTKFVLLGQVSSHRTATMACNVPSPPSWQCTIQIVVCVRTHCYFHSNTHTHAHTHTHTYIQTQPELIQLCVFVCVCVISMPLLRPRLWRPSTKITRPPRRLRTRSTSPSKSRCPWLAVPYPAARLVANALVSSALYASMPRL